MALILTKRGYRTPDGNEIPAIDIITKRLAGDIDADIGPKLASPASVAANYGVFNMDIHRTGDLQVVNFRVDRTATTITNGDTLFTLPVGTRPGFTIHATGLIYPSGSPCGLTVDTTGVVKVFTSLTGQTAVGGTLVYRKYL